MREWLRMLFDGRPWWMNALMVFSGYMAFVYVPWDFFVKPVSEDAEVWFGILFRGTAAKILEIPHFLVYLAGAYGFRKMRPWMWPWAAVYVAQVAIGMLVWNWFYVGGFLGFLLGILSFIPFAALTLALWDARDTFQGPGPTLRERYGDWAVVTGASAGIGAEFARSAARGGMSVALVARREERLRELADELEKAHQVQTRVVACDLADAGASEEIARAVADVEVGLLVNNAGFGYAGRFDKLDPERLRDMVQVNCAAVVALTALLVPKMIERRRGAVIVTSSVAGRQPLPLHGVYSATKAFDSFFGESLAVELRDEGIDVLVVEPGPTSTEFQDAAGEIAHPGEPAWRVVETALDALGRQSTVVSGWRNWLLAQLGRILPRSLVSHIARGVVAGYTPEEKR